MKWTDSCDTLVDFVEEHGGSMGGETRDHLFNIVQNIVDGQAEPVPPSDDLIAIDPNVSPQEIVDALWTCRDTVTENHADPSYVEGYRDGVAEATELAGKLLPMLVVEPVPAPRLEPWTKCDEDGLPTINAICEALHRHADYVEASNNPELAEIYDVASEAIFRGWIETRAATPGTQE